MPSHFYLQKFLSQGFGDAMTAMLLKEGMCFSGGPLQVLLGQTIEKALHTALAVQLLRGQDTAGSGRDVPS